MAGRKKFVVPPLGGLHGEHRLKAELRTYSRTTMGRSNKFLLGRQIREQRAEFGHVFSKLLQPRGWIPDFDTDCRADNDDILIHRHVEKLTKPIRDKQPTAVRQCHRAISRGKQSAKSLDFAPTRFHASRIHLLFDERHTIVDPLLPFRRLPQAQATGSFFGDDAIPFSVRNGFGHFRGQANAKSVIDRPPNFARDESADRHADSVLGNKPIFNQLFKELWARNPQLRRDITDGDFILQTKTSPFQKNLCDPHE